MDIHCVFGHGGIRRDEGWGRGPRVGTSGAAQLSLRMMLFMLRFWVCTSDSFFVSRSLQCARSSRISVKMGKYGRGRRTSEDGSVPGLVQDSEGK